MSAGKYKIYVEQGATFQLNFTLYVNDEVFDLSGYSARLQARASIEDATTIFAASTDDYITLGGNLGTFILEVPAEDTADLPDGHYIYDLELESDTGFVYRVLQGSFIVSPEVTREG